MAVIKVPGAIGVRSHPLWVLDDIAIVVDQIESTVRTHVHVDGPEPGIRRRYELGLLFQTPRAVRRTRIRPDIAVHHIVRRFRQARDTVKRRRERATEIRKSDAAR